MFLPLMGYVANPQGTEDYLATLARPTLATAGPDLRLDETRDVFLGHALLALDPTWKRGAQQIGSCVGWGWALSATVLAACDIAIRQERESYGGKVLEASVYGFARVEVQGKKNLGGDGSYGGAAAGFPHQPARSCYGVRIHLRYRAIRALRLALYPTGWGA